MRIKPFLIEQWFRDFAFDTPLILCNSGVEEFTLGELRGILHIDQSDLDRIAFADSHPYGGAGLRQAVAERWNGGDVARTLITSGSSEAIYLIMNALLQAGDEVIVQIPAYQALYSIAESLGCMVKYWKLDASASFVPDIDELKVLITPRTRMIVVNFPNNPTGATISADSLDQLIEVAAGQGAYLLWDAAYSELVYDGEPLPDPRFRYERAISLGTLSKAYGMPGSRVGWCLAEPDVLARCVRLRDYITISVSPLVEYVAQRAVEQADELVSRRLPQVQRNLGQLVHWVRDHANMIGWTEPRGGASAFLALRGIGDVDAFCRRIAATHGVFILPGSCFGYPDHVRIGFGGPSEQFAEGLSRLGTVFATEGDRLAPLLNRR